MSDHDAIQNARILSLDESVRDIAHRTGRIEATQENILEKVNEGFIDLKKTTASIGERIKPLEEKEAARAKHWGVAKKLLVPALVASAGVFGAKFGSYIVDAISRLF